MNLDDSLRTVNSSFVDEMPIASKLYQPRKYNLPFYFSVALNVILIIFINWDQIDPKCTIKEYYEMHTQNQLLQYQITIIQQQQQQSEDKCTQTMQQLKTEHQHDIEMFNQQLTINKLQCQQQSYNSNNSTSLKIDIEVAQQQLKTIQGHNEQLQQQIQQLQIALHQQTHNECQEYKVQLTICRLENKSLEMEVKTLNQLSQYCHSQHDANISNKICQYEIKQLQQELRQSQQIIDELKQYYCII